MQEERTAGRRWLLVVITLVLLGGIGAGTVFVLRRGEARTNLYEKALRAYRQDRMDTAKEALDLLLESEPGNVKATQLRVAIHLRQNEMEQARERAEILSSQPDREEAGAMMRAQLALATGRLEEAEGLARSIADRAPEFVHSILLAVYEARGTDEDRFRAIDAALNLATLAQSDEDKAAAYLRAGEILLDLCPRLNEIVRDSERAKAERYLHEAGILVRRARQKNPSETLDYLLARIQIRSPDEEVARSGADRLKAAIANFPNDFPAISSLAAYHVDRGNLDEALVLIRELKRGPGLLWLRALRRLAASGHREEALAEVADSPFEDEPPVVTLFHARLLLDGDETSRAQGVAMLEDLVRRTQDHPAIVLRAYDLLRSRRDEAGGLKLLEGSLGRQPNVDVQAVLAAALSRTPQAGDEATRLASMLGGSVTSDAESLRVLAALSRGGREPLLEYLAARIESGGPDAAAHRALRARFRLTWARAGKPGSEETRALRTAAGEDLRAIAADAAATKRVLARAAGLAYVAEQAGLAGALLGRAIGMPGDPEYLPVLTLATALRDGREAARDALAGGLETAGRAAGAPQAFLGLVAGVIRAGKVDPSALLGQIDAVIREPASAYLGHQFGVILAGQVGKLPLAEEHARAALEARPDSSDARRVLGAVLYQRGKFDELLALNPDREGSGFVAREQRIGALLAQERKDEALAAARKLVADFPADPRGYLFLAKIHRADGRTKEALAVLDVAPQNREVLLSRAELLVTKHDSELAEMLYWRLISRNLADTMAWSGLKHSLRQRDALEEFTEHVTRTIKALGDRMEKGALAQLYFYRGQTYEELARPAEALADYERSIETHRVVPAAFNNAAWLILTTAPERLDKARQYIEEALRRAPEQPEFLHTAAMIAAASRDADTAIRFLDQALAKSANPKYLLDRARVQRDAGRIDDARRSLATLLEKHVSSPYAQPARELLAEIDAAGD